MNKLVVSPSPHVHSGLSTAQCMYGVLIALIPAFLVSLYYFGIDAFLVTATSVVACITFEYLIQRYLLGQRTTIGEGSAILTGVLLAFNLPASIPLWIVVVGALFAIGIGINADIDRKGIRVGIRGGNDVFVAAGYGYSYQKLAFIAVGFGDSGTPVFGSSGFRVILNVRIGGFGQIAEHIPNTQKIECIGG